MNESTFFVQIIFIFLFSYGALKLGKSALIASIAIQAILANLFVLKQMTFFGFDITCSDAFAIGSILSLNFLREYYGKDEGKKAISICFFFMVFFVVMSQIHLRFLPSPYDMTHTAYSKLLTPAPRLLIASLATFFIIQRLDLYLFGWISSALPRSSFPMRTTISIAISQLFDTILFSFFGLYGLVASLVHIILISFFIKAIIIIAIGPSLTLLRRLENQYGRFR